MDWRNESVEGVREEARLEKCEDGGCHFLEILRSWDSIRARERSDVVFDDPGPCKYYIVIEEEQINIRKAVNRPSPAGPAPTQTTS